MKKLLLLSAVSLVACGLVAGQASAGIFDLFGGHDDGYYRPYNAFDPIPCDAPHGHHCCLGCCLHHGHACVQPIYVPTPVFVPPPCYGPPPCCDDYGCSCINSGCCDAGCLPAPNGDASPSAPVTPGSQAPNGPKFTPPAPSPLPDTSETFNNSPMQAQPNMSFTGVYPGYSQNFAGNYPGSYPGYYPTAAGNYGGYNSGYYPPSPAGAYGAMRPFAMPYGPNAMPGYGMYGMPNNGMNYYGMNYGR